MVKSSSARGASHTAVAVRLGAFLVAGASFIAILAALAAAGTGHASMPAAAITVSAAIALILLATAAARSLDPLRG